MIVLKPAILIIMAVVRYNHTCTCLHIDSRRYFSILTKTLYLRLIKDDYLGSFHTDGLGPLLYEFLILGAVQLLELEFILQRQKGALT